MLEIFDFAKKIIESEDSDSGIVRAATFLLEDDAFKEMTSNDEVVARMYYKSHDGLYNHCKEFAKAFYNEQEKQGKKIVKKRIVKK